MKLEYETNLKDITEPAVRFYLRSKSFSLQRYREPIWGIVGGCAALYVISLIEGDPIHWVTYVAVAILGYSVIFLTIKDTVSKRIQNHLRREVGHKLPSTTVYHISESQLRCSSLGAETAFELDALTSVKEDSERLELVFGDVGLCTIPLRAFNDDEHKADFLQAIRRGKRPNTGKTEPALTSGA